MKKHSILLSVFASLYILSPVVRAETTSSGEPVEVRPISRMESRTKDVTRDPGLFGDYWWANRFLSRHQLIEGLRGKTVDLVMLGDSIIHFWEWRHPESWKRFCAGRTVLNLGYGGDCTQHVIWRLEHGELDGYVAKRVVVMIGTNNNSSDASDPANVARGVERIVALVRERQPEAEIVLHPIFPRGRSADSAQHAAARRRNDRTNALLKDFAARQARVRWIDFNDRFLDASGWVPESIMADEIHPTDAGYGIWTEALKPTAPSACAEIDRGGLSFDFVAASARKFAPGKTEEKWPVSVRCVVPDATDGIFQVGEGQCGYLWFGMRNEDKAEYDASKFECRLTLPEGIELVGERPRDRVKTPIHIFNDHDPNGYLIRANRGKGVAGEATFACYYEGRQVSRIDRMTIVVVDKVKGVRPKRFMTGIHCGARIAELPTDEGVAAFADMVADSGATWSILECSPRVRDIMHTRGLKVTPYENNWFVNGFMVGHLSRPKEDKYVPLPKEEQPPDGATRYFLRSASCPIAIYSESPFFRTNTVPLLKSLCSGYDGFWANWEPYFFADRGCFCDRCKVAFAKYGKFDVKEFGEGWHKLVLDRKSKYRITCLEIRAREHGRVVRTIDKYVRQFTLPDSFGFVPAVAWIEMGSWYPPIQNAYGSYVKQVRQVDFAGDLKWINPWGPYVVWRSHKPYKYEKRFPMAHFFAARDVREQMAKDYPDGKRPKILSFPLGTLGQMIGEPEWIGMGIDSFFFNRWEASVVYYMPKGGMDARYWRALAEASTRAAKYEDDVIDGRDVSASVAVTPVAEYAVPCKQVSGYIPESTKDKSPLQQVAYERNGRRIVAVFNFWEKGEAFFDLSVKGLKGSFRIVDEHGVVWTPTAKKSVWTAAELAAGVRLEVGASRTRVFEIRPADAGLKGVRKVRTSDETAARYAERRSALAEEAEQDAREESAAPLPKPDNGNVI